MNPSLSKLISNDAVHNQSSSQGLLKTIGSKTIKKQAKGKSILDLLGGMGSFAAVLKESGSMLSAEKNGDGKDCSVHSKGKLIIAKNDAGKELPGITSNKAGKNVVIKKEETITDSESVACAKDFPLDGTMKRSPDSTPSKIAMDEKTEKKIFSGKPENPQFVKGEKAVDTDKVLDLTKALHGQRSDSAQNESALEPGKTASLMKDIPEADGTKKSASGESTALEGEPDPDLKSSTTHAAKENTPTNKYMPEDIKLVRTGDENKNQRPAGDLDASKGFEIKGMTGREVSPATKEHEILLKSNSLKPEGAIPANKINQVNEVMQEYENLFTNGRTSEKPVEKSLNDTLVTKIDTSLGTAQADISGIKGIGNFGSWSNMRADIATSVRFQDIMDQIEESAAQMLKKGPGRIVITLEPPNLGTLNLDVKVHNDMVRLVLIADNHEVKQVLQSNLDQLKTALQDQGLNMDRFDVLVHQRSSENPGFHQWGGALFEEGQGRRENTKEDGSPPQPLPVHGEDVDEPRLGIISLFA